MEKPLPRSCKKHPDYQVLRRPRSHCKVCWAIYRQKLLRLVEARRKELAGLNKQILKAA